MSSTNHLKIINDALHDLLLSEFKVPIDFAKEYNIDFSKNEYIRYWITEQPLISANSVGEDREYIYEIEHYFNRFSMNRIKFNNLIAARIEQMKQLLMENRTYILSIYYWHDANLDIGEIEQIEDKKVYFYHADLHLTRFNQWA